MSREEESPWAEEEAEDVQLSSSAEEQPEQNRQRMNRQQMQHVQQFLMELLMERNRGPERPPLSSSRSVVAYRETNERTREMSARLEGPYNQPSRQQRYEEQFRLLRFMRGDGDMGSVIRQRTAEYFAHFGPYREPVNEEPSEEPQPSSSLVRQVEEEEHVAPEDASDESDESDKSDSSQTGMPEPEDISRSVEPVEEEEEEEEEEQETNGCFGCIQFDAAVDRAVKACWKTCRAIRRSIREIFSIRSEPPVRDDPPCTSKDEVVTDGPGVEPEAEETQSTVKEERRRLRFPKFKFLKKTKRERSLPV